MKIEVWGLGHAGLICAAGLAQQGHHVVGVDIDPARIASLNAGETYFQEPDLSARVRAVVASGRLLGKTPAECGGVEFDAVILCLPTPLTGDGKLDTQFIFDAALPVGLRLRSVSHFQTIFLRSTVPVHFTRNELRPFLEAHSGKKEGLDFGLAMVPEFLREGHAVADFDHPSFVIIGADDPASRMAAGSIFQHAQCATQHVSTGTAEFFKLTNNAFHALKISFANEVARLAHEQEINGQEVLRLLCEDGRLNLSSAYLKPGFAFGGACLEKDLAALQSLAIPAGIPLLAAISVSNRTHLEACRQAILACSYNRIGFYGLTNKAGSDDLRHSPVLALIEILNLPPGTLRVCDPDLRSDHEAFLQKQYGAIVVQDLQDLQQQVDLIINFRTQPLPIPPDYPQVHFATFWDGK